MSAQSNPSFGVAHLDAARLGGTVADLHGAGDLGGRNQRGSAPPRALRVAARRVSVLPRAGQG
eukprot:7242143-Pyramimonas_sp.AAC.1